MQVLQKIIDQGKKVFVFLGEAGSGKSEIAVNWALMLAAMGKPVRFFDMDQTKPLFRSRQSAELLRKNGIRIDVYSQVLDAPTLPHAVFDTIREPDSFTILDIGGSVTGARSVGQFAEAWGNQVVSYLVVNCYRPFSGTQRDMLLNMEEIIMAARVGTVGLISNPNFGEQTTSEDVVEGHKHLATILQGTPYQTELLVVLRRLEIEVRNAFSGADVLGITRYIKAPWE